jgi:transposase InsO family protein
MSPGRAHRLWRAAGLQVPRKRPKKRVAAARPRPQTPCGPNQVWSYDFVFDHCANGQSVTDEFTKEGLAIDVDDRIRSARVIEVLSRLVSERLSLEWFRSRAEAKVIRIRASTISRRTSSLREEQDQRPVGDKCSQRAKPSQANRGPKNLGRPR